MLSCWLIGLFFHSVVIISNLSCLKDALALPDPYLVIDPAQRLDGLYDIMVSSSFGFGHHMDMVKIGHSEIWVRGDVFEAFIVHGS